MKNLKPIFIENSKLPYWLSKIAPIDVWAFSAGPFVVCRGELSEKTTTHETIHFFQQLEMLFIFQWILYVYFMLLVVSQREAGKQRITETHLRSKHTQTT